MKITKQGASAQAPAELPLTCSARSIAGVLCGCEFTYVSLDVREEGHHFGGSRRFVLCPACRCEITVSEAPPTAEQRVDIVTHSLAQLAATGEESMRAQASKQLDVIERELPQGDERRERLPALREMIEAATDDREWIARLAEIDREKAEREAKAAFDAHVAFASAGLIVIDEPQYSPPIKRGGESK